MEEKYGSSTTGASRRSRRASLALIALAEMLAKGDVDFRLIW